MFCSCPIIKKENYAREVLFLPGLTHEGDILWNCSHHCHRLSLIFTNSESVSTTAPVEDSDGPGLGSLAESGSVKLNKQPYYIVSPAEPES
jgi:hypothetical protein